MYRVSFLFDKIDVMVLMWVVNRAVTYTAFSAVTLAWVAEAPQTNKTQQDQIFPGEKKKKKPVLTS